MRYDGADTLAAVLEKVGGAKKKRTARANAKVIEQLAVRKLTRAEAREDNNCAVCLEPLRAQQAVLTLPCKHEYHKTCIIKWLKQSDAPTCPVCKAPALPPDGALSPYRDHAARRVSGAAPRRAARGVRREARPALFGPVSAARRSERHGAACCH